MVAAFSFVPVLAATLIGHGTEKRVVAYLSSNNDFSWVFLLDVNVGLSTRASDIVAASTCCLSRSPDGKMLAFPSVDALHGLQLQVIEANERNWRPLITIDEWRDQSNPNWSPDSSILAYIVVNMDSSDILLTDVSTGDMKQLTTGFRVDGEPSWSPNGKQLVFASSTYFHDGLQLMSINLDGSDLRQLTTGSWDVHTPEFSPNGTKIVFVSREGPEKPQQIYVVDANGGKPTRLTNTHASEYYPHWSPDGTRIAFISTRDGIGKIYVMNIDGSNQRPLTGTRYDPCCAQWSSDGKYIIFTTYSEGNSEIYIVDSISNNLRRLTFNRSEDYYPVWQP
jgi:Tol biopolymer transport system component